MNRKYLIGGVAAAAVLVGGGFGIDAAVAGSGGSGGTGGGLYGAAPSMSAPATTAPVALSTAALKPGTALVDGAGRTLYLFEADTSTMSGCTGGCAQVWPPLLQHGARVSVSGEIQPNLIGSVVRSDGTRQVTYDGHPLYTYLGDKQRGDANGQGLKQFGAAWYVVSPGGTKIDSDG